MWETTKRVVEGISTRKRVYNSLEVGRREALKHMVDLDEFMRVYISTTLTEFSKGTQGGQLDMFPEEKCAELFHALVEDGVLPAALVEAHGGQPDAFWPVVPETIAENFAIHMPPAEEGSHAYDPEQVAAAVAPAAKRPRVADDVPFNACRNFFKTGECKFGETCKFTH